MKKRSFCTRTAVLTIALLALSAWGFVKLASLDTGAGQLPVLAAGAKQPAPGRHRETDASHP